MFKSDSPQRELQQCLGAVILIAVMGREETPSYGYFTTLLYMGYRGTAHRLLWNGHPPSPAPDSPRRKRTADRAVLQHLRNERMLCLSDHFDCRRWIDRVVTRSRALVNHWRRRLKGDV